MADADISVRFGANVGELVNGVNEAKAAIESVTGPVDGLVSSFAGLGEAAAAAFAVKEIADFVQSMGELGEQTERMSKILGITPEQVGELGFAAQMTGTDTGNLAMMMGRFEAGLAGAEKGTGRMAEGLKALGLSAKELQGLNFDQQMNKIADATARFADGTAKTAALGALGRGFVQMIPLLDEGSAGLNRMRAQADTTNSVLDEMTTGRLVEMQHGFVTLGASIKGVEIEAFKPFIGVAEAVAGQMTQLAQAFSNSVKSGGMAGAELNALATALKASMTFSEGLTEAVIQVGITGDMAFAAVRDSVVGFGSVTRDIFVTLGNAIPGFFTALVTAGEEAVRAVERQFTDLGTVIGDTLKLDFAGAKAAAASMSDDAAASAAKIGGAFKGVFDFSQADADAKAASAKVAADLQAGGERMVASARDSMVQIKSLWGGAAQGAAAPTAQVPAMVDMSGAAAAAKQAAKDVEDAFTRDTEAAKNTETLVIDSLNNELKTHQITMSQWLAQTNQALDAEAMAVINAADKATASAALSSQQKEAIWAKEATDLTQIAKQESDAQAKAAEASAASSKSAADTIAGTMNSQVDGLLRQTESVRQAFKNMAASMIEDTIKYCIKWADEHAATALANIASTNSVTAAILTAFGIQTAAASTGAAGQIGAATTQKAAIVPMDAGTAGAGVAAWLAPMIGPAAVPAGAEAAAEVLAIGSADIGGYVLSSGLAMVHADETITPAKMAQPYSPSMGGAPSVSANVAPQFHFHSMDSSTIAATLRANGGALAKAVNQAVRDGAHHGLRRLAGA
ncbi:MAG: hypothetical protein ABSC25_24355 [Roseiarcus sp.]|jgi:hypothetical protein